MPFVSHVVVKHVTHTLRITSSLFPFVLFGDTGSSYNGQVLQPGSYTVTTQPFSETQASGIAGPIQTVNFTIAEPITPLPTPAPFTPLPTPAPTSHPTPAPTSSPTLHPTPFPTLNPTPFPVDTSTTTHERVTITDFVLVDASSNTDIQNGFRCGKFLCANGATLLDIRSDVTAGVESVRFTITGPVQETRIENTAPFVLFGNDADNYNGRQLPPGAYTVTAQPFSEKDTRGRSGGISTVMFSVPDLSITRFVLVDAATDTDIPGGLYCLPFACTGDARSFNIRAEIAGDVESVELTLKKDGQIISNRIENDDPYSHAGDVLGDYNGQVLKGGQYTIEAKAYPLPDGQGMPSPVQSLDFTIRSARRKLLRSP